MSDPEQLANFVVERMREEPRVRKIVEEARLYDTLQQDPGWKRLNEHVKENYSTWMKRFASRLMRGERVPQDEIDFHRGFYTGALWVVGHPEQAEASLEQAAQEAWRQVRRETLLQQEQDSPYLIRDIPQEGDTHA